ncbi:MAG: phosphoribosylformylglycinamidine cyclo-ligase [Dehalococcoidales bacterium]
MRSKAVRQTYASAGVNIDIAAKTKDLIGKQARSTHVPGVLSGVGFFGGLFELKGYRQPVLVSSADGVGTKLKIAADLDKHDTIGIDLVNHCVNDILTCRAKPLFFLDYIGTGRLVPEQVEDIARGLARACWDVGCALIGGETAEMPGLYAGKDYDLVGFIVGVVEKENLAAGKAIRAGDTILGLPSSGLHTNGYSLVRRIFDADQFRRHYKELGRTLGEELLEPHRCYYKEIKPLLPRIKGLAHITGGGLIDNVPRILPPDLTARFNRQAWTVPPIFQLIREQGNVDEMEMYRVFNMGIGMVLISSPGNAAKLRKALPEAITIGEVVKQAGEERVIIDQASPGIA